MSSSIADSRAQMNPESRQMLPKLAFTGFASRYLQPTITEGLEDITTVDFTVSPAAPYLDFCSLLCPLIRMLLPPSQNQVPFSVLQKFFI